MKFKLGDVVQIYPEEMHYKINYIGDGFYGLALLRNLHDSVVYVAVDDPELRLAE